MRKYYVSCGDIQAIVMASTGIQAAVKSFRLPTPVRNLATSFRVSERGFDVHDDDELIDTATVIWVLDNARKAM